MKFTFTVSGELKRTDGPGEDAETVLEEMRMEIEENIPEAIYPVDSEYTVSDVEVR